jgi:hypothetical protein
MHGGNWLDGAAPGQKNGVVLLVDDRADSAQRAALIQSAKEQAGLDVCGCEDGGRRGANLGSFETH